MSQVALEKIIQDLQLLKNSYETHGRYERSAARLHPGLTLISYYRASKGKSKMQRFQQASALYVFAQSLEAGEVGALEYPALCRFMDHLSQSGSTKLLRIAVAISEHMPVVTQQTPSIQCETGSRMIRNHIL